MSMRAVLSFVILGAVVGGCGAERGLAGPEGVGAPAPEAAPAVPQALGCLTDGTFGLSVRWAGLTAWEGRLVRVVVIENEGTPPVARRPVDWVGRIAGGAFAISCPSALRENYHYPSYASFVDLDGDGRCGPRDAGSQIQWYGYNAEIDVGSADLLNSLDGWSPPDKLYAGIGTRREEGFCGYFE